MMVKFMMKGLFKMKLCVFCGTFNPIHNAHLAMANFVKNNFKYDKILFIPSFNPPHKDIISDYSKDRFNMVKLAIEDSDYFELSDVEYHLKEKSYTFNTINLLYEKNPDIDGKIGFIIGTDAFLNIEKWYKADLLKNLVDFIVFPRTANFDKSQFSKLKDLDYNFKFADMPFIDISSTILRELIKNKENCEN